MSDISPLSEIHGDSRLAANVTVGPFCVIGPHVSIGPGTRLDSHVTIVGHTTIGRGNRFFPGSVIGADPQDKSYRATGTRLEIGDDNVFREGVTINRGSEKEDGCTRVGSRNLMMANAHVAHNCHVHDDVTLTNAVLLGGHVHVHDRATLSGNTAVHHFTTIGTLSFTAGCCRLIRDLPPYMQAAHTDRPRVVAVNTVGLKRAGFAAETILLLRRAFFQLFRKHRPLPEVRAEFDQEFNGELPFELTNLFDFIHEQEQGRNGRAREIYRQSPPAADITRQAA